VAGLLSELSVEVSPYDGIFLSGLQVGLGESLDPNGSGPVAHAVTRALQPAQGSTGLTIEIERAVPLTIVEDGLPISLQSIQPTLGEALREAGINLGPADEVYPSTSSEVTAGMQVEIRHAKAISLRMGDFSQIIYTHKETLDEALAESGFALGAEDRVEPALGATVLNGMSARLVRVAGRTFTERETVQKKTVFQPDENLSGSASRIVQGSDGLKLREYKVVIEDGQEVERTLTREYFEPEVVDTVIYYAASTVRATGLTPENFNVADMKHLYATWYNAASSGKPATHPAYGITYTGVPVTRGIVAVDPNVIPLGTRMFVPGYGFAVAADTGGGIIGDMIDLGYPDGVAVDWRTGWVDVYVLGP
jgi:3D (Asp-Asp-Asp) domain-containing protein